MSKTQQLKEENQKLKDFAQAVATLFDRRDIDLTDELFALVNRAKALLVTPPNGGTHAQGSARTGDETG